MTFHGESSEEIGLRPDLGPGRRSRTCDRSYRVIAGQAHVHEKGGGHRSCTPEAGAAVHQEATPEPHTVAQLLQ